MTQAVNELLQTYKDEFQVYIQDVQDKAQHLPQIAQETIADAQKMMPKGDSDITKKIQDVQTPVADEAVYVRGILPLYLWLGLCLLGYGIGYTLGGLAPMTMFLGLFLSGPLAAFGAIVGVPMLIFTYNKKEDKEGPRRMNVLVGSLLMGAMAGHAFQDCYLTITTPPLWLFPLSLALLAAIGGPAVMSARTTTLGLLIGGPMAVEFVFGVMTGNMNATYMIYLLAYTGVFFIAVQINLSDQDTARGDAAVRYQLEVMAAAIAIQGLCTFMLSFSKEKAAQVQKEETKKAAAK